MKNVPQLRFKGFNDAWQHRKIGEVMTVKAGGDVDKAKLKATGKYPVIANALTNDGIVGYYDDYQVKAPAVTITGRGTLGHAVARLVNFTPIVRLLTARSATMNANFIANAINQLHIYNESTGVPQLTAVQLKTYTINYPTLAEQQRIGDFLRRLDCTINLQAHKITLLKQLKQGYLQKLFPQAGQTTPQLRFKGFNDKYQQVKLGEILKTVTDYVANGSFKVLRDHVNTHSNEDYAYMIRLQDYNNKWHGPWLFTTKDSYLFLKKSKLFESDIIMSNVGTVGTIFKLPKLDKPATLAPNAILIRPKQYIYNDYLFYILNSNFLKKELYKKITPGVQPKINKTDLKSIVINLTIDLQEQQRIGALFAKLDHLIELQNHKLALLEELKKGYLQKMFI